MNDYFKAENREQRNEALHSAILQACFDDEKGDFAPSFKPESLESILNRGVPNDERLTLAQVKSRYVAYVNGAIPGKQKVAEKAAALGLPTMSGGKKGKSKMTDDEKRAAAAERLAAVKARDAKIRERFLHERATNLKMA